MFQIESTRRSPQGREESDMAEQQGSQARAVEVLHLNTRVTSQAPTMSPACTDSHAHPLFNPPEKLPGQITSPCIRPSSERSLSTAWRQAWPVVDEHPCKCELAESRCGGLAPEAVWRGRRSHAGGGLSWGAVWHGRRSGAGGGLAWERSRVGGRLTREAVSPGRRSRAGGGLAQEAVSRGGGGRPRAGEDMKTEGEKSFLIAASKNGPQCF